MNWPDDYLIPGITPYHVEDAGIIYCADCRDILPHLPKVDLVLTDPPYGLGKRLHDGGTWATHKKYDAMLQWDSVVENKLLEAAIAKGGSSIVWGGNYYPFPPSRCWLAWVKKNNVPTMADFELAWTSLNKPSKKKVGNIHPDGVNQHPTQKPLYLMKWCIQFCNGTSGIILDPFLGSGTTAVAAKELGRKFIGIEISEEYCKIAVKRLRQGVLDFG